MLQHNKWKALKLWQAWYTGGIEVKIYYLFTGKQSCIGHVLGFRRTREDASLDRVSDELEKGLVYEILHSKW
jgi:hypothetical protein